MPLAVGAVLAPLRRSGRHCCLRQSPRSGWLASVARAHAARPAAGSFLRDYVAQRAQMRQSGRKSRQAAGGQSSDYRSTPAATDAKSDLGSKAFPGSLSLRARTTGAFLGALS